MASILKETYKNPADIHCSPKMHEHAEKDRTCFSLEELKLIVAEFNKKSEPAKQITATTKKGMVAALLKAYKPICDKNQYCWIKQTLAHNTSKLNKLESNFRVKMPNEWVNNQNTWLNTYDILYVMKQYEELYKDFVFLNVTPIDFAEKNSFGRCIGDMLCDFNVKDLLARQKTRFGIVFNTDPSTRGGQHWIMIYCNLDSKKPNYGIYFYDSVASPAPHQVKTFMKKIVGQVPEENRSAFECKENKIQRQYSNYDCGMFCIVFLTQCLKNIKFDIICKNMYTDEKINSLRKVLYRPA